VTDPDRSRIISFWHERASKTGATATRFHAEHLDYDLAALAPFCRAGARVLEIGCGQCVMLNTLVQKFGVTAHGVELVASYLDQAIKDERLTTEVADAVDYTPRPGFDVVILAGLINSIPAVEERRQIYRRIAQALAPGRLLFVKSQFGRTVDVDVDAWSEALGAHYRAHYPQVDREAARLGEWFDVEVTSPYPAALNPHANTRFHHLLCRAR
jgi:SAM-dependent methyltransferase